MAVIDGKSDRRALQSLDASFLCMPLDVAVVESFLRDREENALACALARRPAFLGLSLRQRDLFILQGIGLQGEALYRAMGIAGSAVRTMRARLRERGIDIDAEARAARRLYRCDDPRDALGLPPSPQEEPTAAPRGRRRSGTRSKASPGRGRRRGGM
jgi:biotin operon repressor